MKCINILMSCLLLIDPQCGSLVKIINLMFFSSWASPEKLSVLFSSLTDSCFPATSKFLLTEDCQGSEFIGLLYFRNFLDSFNLQCPEGIPDV